MRKISPEQRAEIALLNSMGLHAANEKP